MGARPPEGAAFEVSRIGGPGSPAHLATVLWAGALAIVIALGVFGRGHEVPIDTAVAASVAVAVAGRAPTPESSQPAALDTNVVPDYGPPTGARLRALLDGPTAWSPVNVLWHNPQSR